MTVSTKTILKAAARTLLPCILLVLGLAAQTAYAQDTAAGTWQGTLQADRPLRLVIVVSRSDTALAAVMHSIDQGAGAIAGTVTQQGTTIRIAIPAIGGSYDGRLNADGNAIAGTFTQGGKSLTLSLLRATPDATWPIPTPPATLTPMAADATPSFEVATIKPSEPNRPGKLFTVRGREVLTINTTVNDLMSMAYGVHARQIVLGPDWIGTEKFDIAGPSDVPGRPNIAQIGSMVKGLLADRFHLTFHREQRDLPVYALVMADKGSKLTRSAGADGLPSLVFRALGVLPGANATMSDFAGVMQRAVLDRPVVDRTGLTGRFDFMLTWTPDESQFASMGVRVPPPSTDPSAPPGLFTAIQEQMGLKFESTKAPVDVIVIDRIERPSAN